MCLKKFLDYLFYSYRYQYSNNYYNCYEELDPLNSYNSDNELAEDIDDISQDIYHSR